MKLSKSLLALFLVAFLAIFVVGVALKVYWSVSNPAPTASKLAYVLKPSVTDAKVGDKITVPVYLLGQDAANVTALDVRFTYDATKLKLVSSVPGTFFEKYLTVKWDQKTAWFALAMTPSTPKKQALPASPILTLEFTAIGKTDSASLSTGASTVYVTKTGGFHPQTGTVSFSIK